MYQVAKLKSLHPYFFIFWMKLHCLACILISATILNHIQTLKTWWELIIPNQPYDKRYLSRKYTQVHLFHATTYFQWNVYFTQHIKQYSSISGRWNFGPNPISHKKNFKLIIAKNLFARWIYSDYDYSIATMFVPRIVIVDLKPLRRFYKQISTVNFILSVWYFWSLNTARHGQNYYYNIDDNKGLRFIFQLDEFCDLRYKKMLLGPETYLIAGLKFIILIGLW
jgi:hypothetical protein